MKVYLSNKIIIFTFILIFIFGLHLSEDFGVSWDEHYHRKQGKQTISYVAKFLSLDKFFPSTKNYKNPEIGIGGYGPAFEIFCLCIEKLLSVEDIKNKYLLKHKLNFTIIFISVFLFYLFIKKKFTSVTFGLIGSMFYFLNPRTFAHSFYNPKDSISQALLACALLPLLLSYKNKKISMAVASGILIGIAITIRLPVLYLPILFVCTMISYPLIFKTSTEDRRKILLTTFYFILSLSLSTVFFFPHLWESPIHNFIKIFNNLNKIQWIGNNLFFGDLIPASNVPWYYIITWIFISTPLTFVFFLIVGSMRLIFDIFTSHGKDNLFKAFMLFGFITPLMAIIVLNSTLYNGWRHLFFVYPFIAYLMTYGFKFVFRWLSMKFKSDLVYALIFCTFIHPIYFIYISHPNQQVFFNRFAGKNALENFEGDYWANSVSQLLKWIAENDEKDVVNVVSPFNVAAKNNVILDKKDRDRFHYFALKNENSIAQGYKSLSSTEDVKNNSTNYIITNSRLKREGYLSGSENKLYTVKSGDLEIFSLYRFD